MDSKLKSLKVVDLRAILSKANVSCPAKSNKQDLIARIIASQPATQIYYQLYPDKNVDNPPAPVLLVEQVTPKVVLDPLSQSKPSPSAQPTSVPLDTPKDLEAEKRSQRAARFGIPIVEQPKPHPVSVAPNGAPATSKPPTSAKSVPDDPEKLKARAARFGIQHVVEASMGQKRPAIPEHVDAEEAERRKKRAERFGLNSVA